MMAGGAEREHDLAGLKLDPDTHSCDAATIPLPADKLIVQESQ